MHLKKAIVIVLILSVPVLVAAQKYKAINRIKVIEYLNKYEDTLNPIEGIWSLSVVSTLYDREGNEVKQIAEKNKSTWAVINIEEDKFLVIDIGESAENCPEDFVAYFESTSDNDTYNYRCLFKKPDWLANTDATLSEGSVLEYDYFVSKKYMKKHQNYFLKRGLWLHWSFVWIKKYPQEDNIASSIIKL
ncbi:MAG: hypothetical protein MUE95_10070 [Cyclobacteriaceae bacterium]|jgi:hypothetical protein|nr:hypothetical protein [Cyclobacteriaceae bacterium]